MLVDTFELMIEQFYPQAWRHLQAARGLKAEMASTWHSLLDDGLVHEAVITDPGGSGRIVAYANWPTGRQDELTTQFRECVSELWVCLDSLVAESVDALSVLRRARNPDQPRFFPIADSTESFEALLEQSCLDGVLQPQFEMVRDCQPFRELTGDVSVDRLRRGIRQLLAWDHALEAGAQMGAWATPVEPQVRVEEPVIVDGITAQEPGEIADERLLATYQLRNYEFDRPVAGQAGTYVDLCFATGFTPSRPDDTFDKRLSAAIDVVTRFAIYFAWFSSQIAGARRVLLGDGLGVRQTWVNAAQSSRLWSAKELSELVESDIGLGRVVDADNFTLIVSTPNGVYERVIPQATPLRAHDRRGVAAEAAIQDAAATWGLPDFVMVPSVERKGAGVREISDGLLVVGKLGVIVQAKSRETEPGSLERESSWINKQVVAATKQIDGTARRLKGSEATMQNGRGRGVRINGSSIDWIGVVIIEHPNPPEDFVLTMRQGRNPAVVLLRRDWEFLFDQLRSTHAVVSYLHRVGEPTEILGREPERYYELAIADREAKPGPIDPVLIGRGELHSVPLLPAAPAGSDDDDAHGMVRIMLEDIATTRVEPERQDARQEILASLDSLPVGHRTELGRLLLDALTTARETEPESTWWTFRTFLVGPEQDQLGFGVCSALNEMTRAAFSAWLLLRHHERGERAGSFADLTSIGVLLTPRNDGYRDWDTTMNAVHDDPELTEEDLQQYRELWNGTH